MDTLNKKSITLAGFDDPIGFIQLLLGIFGAVSVAVGGIIAWINRMGKTEGKQGNLYHELTRHIEDYRRHENHSENLEREMRQTARELWNEIEEMKNQTNLSRYRIEQLERKFNGKKD